jgi:hypothetical protein
VSGYGNRERQSDVRNHATGQTPDGVVEGQVLFFWISE